MQLDPMQTPISRDLKNLLLHSQPYFTIFALFYCSVEFQIFYWWQFHSTIAMQINDPPKSIDYFFAWLTWHSDGKIPRKGKPLEQWFPARDNSIQYL